mmetsp:Transcript_107498/g.272783  ORF Transcript_107498/g.272783 Transcript_107498/m.272783 type:complete len:304 (-) Transcript_107498:65-976(-)
MSGNASAHPTPLPCSSVCRRQRLAQTGRGNRGHRQAARRPATHKRGLPSPSPQNSSSPKKPALENVGTSVQVNAKRSNERKCALSKQLTPAPILEPPIHSEYLHSDGTAILIFIVGGTDAVNSFDMRSPMFPEHRGAAEPHRIRTEVLAYTLVDHQNELRCRVVGAACLLANDGHAEKTALGRDLHHVFREVAVRQVKHGMTCSRVPPSEMATRCASPPRVHDDARGAVGSIPREHDLDDNLHLVRVEGQGHVLPHVHAVGHGVQRGNRLKPKVLLGCLVQLVVKGVALDRLQLVRTTASSAG